MRTIYLLSRFRKILFAIEEITRVRMQSDIPQWRLIIQFDLLLVSSMSRRFEYVWRGPSGRCKIVSTDHHLSPDRGLLLPSQFSQLRLLARPLRAALIIAFLINLDDNLTNYCNCRLVRLRSQLDLVIIESYVTLVFFSLPIKLNFPIREKLELVISIATFLIQV